MLTRWLFASCPAGAARQRMLASYPLYFVQTPEVTVYLMQGDAGNIVTPWNATDMMQRLRFRLREADVTLDIFPSGTHASTLGRASSEKHRREYLADCPQTY